LDVLALERGARICAALRYRRQTTNAFDRLATATTNKPLVALLDGLDHLLRAPKSQAASEPPSSSLRLGADLELQLEYWRNFD
jgi:hypothetical protein